MERQAGDHLLEVGQDGFEIAKKDFGSRLGYNEKTQKSKGFPHVPPVGNKLNDSNEAAQKNDGMVLKSLPQQVPPKTENKVIDSNEAAQKYGGKVLKSSQRKTENKVIDSNEAAQKYGGKVLKLPPQQVPQQKTENKVVDSSEAVQKYDGTELNLPPQQVPPKTENNVIFSKKDEVINYYEAVKMYKRKLVVEYTTSAPNNGKQSNFFEKKME